MPNGLESLTLGLDLEQSQGGLTFSTEPDNDSVDVDIYPTDEVQLQLGLETAIVYRSSFRTMHHANKPYVGTKIIGKTR